MVKCLLSVAQTFILSFSLVCYSNICNRLSETNAPEHRVQTSLKRCGLKFSLRYDMSAKFPRGGGGAGPFLARSLYSNAYQNKDQQTKHSQTMGGT